VEVVQGHDALAGLGSQFDDLATAVGAPVTARRPWLQAWVDCYPTYEPVVLVLRSGAGRLEAAAPLAARRRRGSRTVTALGHGPSDSAMLLARSSSAADVLAAGITEWLDRDGQSWTLVLRHLVSEDLIAERLSAQLTRVRSEPGAVSPQLHVANDRAAALSEYVSTRHQSEVRRRWRRMTKDGLQPIIRQVVTRDEISQLMPEVERVYRTRDADLNRRCALDNKAQGAFFRQVIDVHAARREVRLTTLTLGGSLAAYVLCFVDGQAYRMWTCRFDPTFARYSAGMVAMDASVEDALAMGCQVYDFMRGEELYKASYANHQARGRDVRAWSGRLLETRFRLWRGMRNRAETWERHGGTAAKLSAAARKAAERVQAK